MIVAFKYVSISSKESTSEIFGILLISTSSSHKIAAGIKATALFFDPDTSITPDNLFPPSIFIFGISYFSPLTLLYSF